MNSIIQPSRLALAAASVVLIAGCSSSAKEMPIAPPTPVHIADVVEGASTLPISTSGRLSPKTQIQLSFKTGGLVDRIYVDEGDRLRRGQLLASLNLAEIDAQVRQARSAYEKAERDASRMQTLFRDSVATLEQLQNTETALSVAESALEIALFNRQHSEIRAPADGRVLSRAAEVNELVTPGQTVFVLGAAGGWVVRIGLADRDVVKLRLRDPATFRFDAFPDRVFDGRVSEIAEAADPMTGTFEVEVSVDDPESRLKSGFIAHVNLFPSTDESFDLIPIEALVEADGEVGVIYTYDTADGRVMRHEIRIAHILGDTLAVRSGLEGGEPVVTSGAPYLSNGDLVDVVN